MMVVSSFLSPGAQQGLFSIAPPGLRTSRSSSLLAQSDLNKNIMLTGFSGYNNMWCLPPHLHQVSGILLGTFLMMEWRSE